MHSPQVVVHAAEDGACLGSFSAYDDALGAKAAAWSPGGDVLAVGSYDQVCVRELSAVHVRVASAAAAHMKVDASHGVEVCT